MPNHLYARIALSAFCAAVSLSAAHADDLQVISDVKESGMFTIANSLSYAPFEYIDADGQPAGFDVELATAAAAAMGAKLDIQTIPFANQIPALVAGRNKVAWATFTVTEERLEQVDFVSFLQTGVVIVTMPEMAETFAVENAACGRKIAVQTGSSADFVADKLAEQCTAAGLAVPEKEIYPDQKDTIQALMAGRVDARLDDDTAAGYFQKTSDGKQVVVGKSMFPAPLGVAVRKGDTATAEMMKAVLGRLIADGTYAKLIENYGLAVSGVAAPVIYTDPAQLTK